MDLIIIGAGPAGLAAACEARQFGLSVALLDEQPAIGGQIYRNIGNAPPDRLSMLGPDYAAGRELAAEFLKSGARYVPSAAVWNLASEGGVDYLDPEGAQKIVGRRVLLASGAMERPFPIPGWTLPGVMGAGAAQILLKGAGAVPSNPVVLAGCGPLLYLLAWQYLRAGIKLSAVVDTTRLGSYLRALPLFPGAMRGWKDLTKGIRLLASLRRHRVPVYSGACDLAVEGSDRAEALTFRTGGKPERIPASLVLLHQGVVPNVQLSWSLGVEHRWSEQQLCWLPVTDEAGRFGETPFFVAGDSRGIIGATASVTQGRLAALAIAEQLGFSKGTGPRRHLLRDQLSRQTRIRPFLDALYRPLNENRIPRSDDVVVCRCEETTAGQIRDYVKLGCLGPNQAKAYGRSGMGPCQGRMCGLTVTELIAEARGVGAQQVGYYRIRPPIKPITLGDFVPKAGCSKE